MDSSLNAAPTAEPSSGIVAPAAGSAGEVAAEPKIISLPGGTIVTPRHFYSPTLAKNTWYEVILPPGYHHSSRRFPVLYMLHGAMGGASEWVDIGLHETADRLWSQGEIEPFVIVLPEGGMLNYWLNHSDGGPRYSDYLVKDVVREIDDNYRTIKGPDSRALGGLSMGGDGALRLALRHPDVFGVAGAHSPTTRMRYEDRPGAFYEDEDYFWQNNSLWLIQNTEEAAALKIWIDIGEDDVWVTSAEALHQALLDKQVKHEYAVLPGQHEAEYWTAYQGSYLEFYNEAFESALVRTMEGEG